MLYTNILLGLLALSLSGVSSAFPVEDSVHEVSSLTARGPTSTTKTPVSTSVSTKATKTTSTTAPTATATGGGGADDADPASPTAISEKGSTKSSSREKIVPNKYVIYLKGDADVAAHLKKIKAYKPPSGEKVKIKTKIEGEPIDLRLANPPMWIYVAFMDKLTLQAVRADKSWAKDDQVTLVGPDSGSDSEGGEESSGGV